ncbi:DUF6286 domain-containing Asp23/Gls24 family envelope stress response protein [Streptomyces sp. NPDC058417]|uniref:DUF6286 domain-containing Asp23/Gls24 family envelope stress response protein n=1 Tax=unclassified Streptomyces TaxID=2593676 RepID=UPI00364D81D6
MTAPPERPTTLPSDGDHAPVPAERDRTTVPSGRGRTAVPPERGRTTVSERAVRRIAERAVSEALPGAAARATGSAAAVRGRRADVGLQVTLPFPARLPEAARTVQEHVAARTRQLTGLDTPPPRLAVTALDPVRTAEGVAGPERPDGAVEAESADALPGMPPTPRTPLRRWSQRRAPVALLALAAALGCGALATDLVLVHAAHRAPAPWRTEAVDLASRLGPGHTAGPWIGAGCLALGLLMVVLAVTPGHRRLLTLTSPGPRLRATVDRSAVAALVRDAVSDVPGVGAVRVRARRRRVAVRAEVAFGDLAVARGAAETVAREALAACGLRRAMRLRVVLRSHPARDPAAPEHGGDTVPAQPDRTDRTAGPDGPTGPTAQSEPGGPGGPSQPAVDALEGAK